MDKPQTTESDEKTEALIKACHEYYLLTVEKRKITKATKEAKARCHALTKEIYGV